MIAIEIILPERADDELSKRLSELTSLLDPDQSYGLGGPDGYGANFENDVFMMHRFCWCEGADCPWCGGCECDASDELGMIRGYGTAGIEVGGTCAYCRGEHHSDKGAVAGKGAPNFWHKPTGFKVWWYKWIGRDNEIVGPPDANISSILDDCTRSVQESGSKSSDESETVTPKTRSRGETTE
jgi:hypothetical protein